MYLPNLVSRLQAEPLGDGAVLLLLLGENLLFLERCVPLQHDKHG